MCVLHCFPPEVRVSVFHVSKNSRSGTTGREFPNMSPESGSEPVSIEMTDSDEEDQFSVQTINAARARSGSSPGRLPPVTDSACSPDLPSPRTFALASPVALQRSSKEKKKLLWPSVSLRFAHLKKKKPNKNVALDRKLLCLRGPRGSWSAAACRHLGSVT